MKILNGKAGAADVGFGGLDCLCLVLMVLGSLNWGAVALFGRDAVSLLLGEASVATRVAYGTIALAGMYGLSFAFRSYHRF